MKTQTAEFVIYKKGNVVKRIGRSIILQPKTNFKGGQIRWYEDKPKKGK